MPDEPTHERRDDESTDVADQAVDDIGDFLDPAPDRPEVQRPAGPDFAAADAEPEPPEDRPS